VEGAANQEVDVAVVSLIMSVTVKGMLDFMSYLAWHLGRHYDMCENSPQRVSRLLLDLVIDSRRDTWTVQSFERVSAHDR
jgi:hypothetical protein